MKGTKDIGIPEFRSLEEERGYWEASGPLAEGRKGRINKLGPDQRRSSFLAVRLTGEELTRLRDIATERGLGPSTFARLLLTSVIKSGGKLPSSVTLKQLKDSLEMNLPQSIRDKAEALARDSAIGGPDNPSLIILDVSQMKEAEELLKSLFRALLSMAGVQVITPEDKGYKKLRGLVDAQR